MSSSVDSIIRGMRIYCLASTFCELKVGERLKGGSLPASILADQMEIDEVRLGRVMKGFVWAEFLTYKENEYALTDLGASLSEGAKMFQFTSEFFYHPWLCLGDYLKGGEAPYEAYYGKPLFEHLGDVPRKKALFYDAMKSSTEVDAKEIAAKLSFAVGSVIIDVGGGHGQLAKVIKETHPYVHCEVLDLPNLGEEARAYLGGACDFIAGNMFTDLPSDRDFYFLKWMLHDWDDHQAVALLKHCHEKMKDGAKVVIIERIFDAASLSRVEMVNRDLNMLVLNGGRERTLEEYQALLKEAGLKMQEVLELKSGFSMITGVK